MFLAFPLSVSDLSVSRVSPVFILIFLNPILYLLYQVVVEMIMEIHCLPDVNFH